MNPNLLTKYLAEGELRQHVIDVLLMVLCLTLLVLCCASVSLVIELHNIRRDQQLIFTDIKNGVFARMDSLLWKADTLTAIASATEKSLGNGLMQVRVQVKESNDTSREAMTEVKTAAVSATKAVDKALQATNEAVQAVADKQPSVVEVQAQKPTIVTAAPQEIKVVHEPPLPVKEQSPALATERKTRHSLFHWLRWLKFW